MEVVVKRGDVGSTVKFLQEMLNRSVTASRLSIDGDFGPATERSVLGALRTFGISGDPKVVDRVLWGVLQSRSFLRVDEKMQSVPLEPVRKVDGSNNRTKTPLVNGWNQYGGLLDHICKMYKLTPDVAVAVLAIESAGRAFDEGRPIIRFENHIFWRFWGRFNAAQFKQHFSFSSSSVWKNHFWREDPEGKWEEQHTRTNNQDREWEVLAFARSLDDTAALYSTSWGAPQVMGFNHRKIGYQTPQEMVAAFQQDARWHILALFDFFRADARMLRGLQTRDFVQFAGVYNGPGKAEDYGARIKAAADLARSMGIG